MDLRYPLRGFQVQSGRIIHITLTESFVTLAMWYVLKKKVLCLEGDSNEFRKDS